VNCDCEIFWAGGGKGIGGKDRSFDFRDHAARDHPAETSLS